MATRSASAVPLFIPIIQQLGGAERSLLALARHLHRHGRPVTLITYEDQCDFVRFADFPLQIEVLGPGRIAALRHFLAGRPADAPLPLASGYQPALHLVLAGHRDFHCLMHDTPALFHPEAGPPPFRQRLRTAISNRIIGLHRRGHMIVTSEFLRAECSRDFGIAAEIVRMGGMGSPDGFRPRSAAGGLRFLSVSRIEPNKRIDWILRAFAALEHAEIPLSQQLPWRLDIAGKGSLLEPMRTLARQLGIGDRVHLPGFVSDTDLEQLYDQANAFLMPAVQGYGIPAIEALQRGIPVLLHRESGVSDILLDTPWAVVLTGGADELPGRLRQMIDFLVADGPRFTPAPAHLPTETSWAAQVCRLCGYLPD